MSLDADFIVDRRRMRRKLTFWRVFAVLFAISVITFAIFNLIPNGDPALDTSMIRCPL